MRRLIGNGISMCQQPIILMTMKASIRVALIAGQPCASRMNSTREFNKLRYTILLCFHKTFNAEWENRLVLTT